MRKSIALAALMVLASIPAFSAGLEYLQFPKKEVLWPYRDWPVCKGRLQEMDHCVNDGDTLRIAYRSYRIGDLDTPETGKKAKCDAERDKAEAVKRLVATMLSQAHMLKVTTYVHPLKQEEARDKYGRILSKVEIDGHDLAELLIENGLAHHYDGTTKQPWCD